MAKLPAITPIRAGLFAKKGEAAPAGIPVRDPTAAGSAPSGLSFLIQRRVGPMAEAPAAAQGAAAAAAPTGQPAPQPVPQPVPQAMAMALAATWASPLTEEYPTAPAAEADAGGIPPSSGDQQEWRKIGVRIRSDYHRRLKNVSRLWGVSCQSLIQKAIANYLESALTDDSSNWRH